MTWSKPALRFDMVVIAQAAQAACFIFGEMT